MNNNDLIERLRQILPGILENTPVTLAYLHGSRAREAALPTSDVDIALFLGRNPLDISSQERWHLESSVEIALEQQGIINTDARLIDDLPLPFRGEVAVYRVRLYSRDEEARVEFETQTWKRYFDFQPTARMMRRAFINHIREHGLTKG